MPMTSYRFVRMLFIAVPVIVYLFHLSNLILSNIV